MTDWSESDLAGMELCKPHGERLKFCRDCRDIAAMQRGVCHSETSRPATASVAPKAGTLRKAAAKRGMNKWETEFALRLQDQKDTGLIFWYQFEGLRFRLADGAWYKPDFVALSYTGELIVYEVKGHWREASRVRIKVAADRHPFRFIASTKRRVKDGGGWAEEALSAALDRINLETQA